MHITPKNKVVIIYTQYFIPFICSEHTLHAFVYLKSVIILDHRKLDLLSLICKALILA